MFVLVPCVVTGHSGPEKETHTSLTELGATNGRPCHLSVGAEAAASAAQASLNFLFGLRCRKNTQVPVNPDVDNCRRNCWKARKNNRRLMTSNQETGREGCEEGMKLGGRRERLILFSQNKGCGFPPSHDPPFLGQPQSGSLSAPSFNTVDVHDIP